ncbi:MAG TPA: homoaconitase [Caldithrix abyssi]|uniref:Aconitate hydratase A n=1 Tax=Caldithrix abyssi TaxID=187145 RepID=A0A7V5RPC4_CALAY|nr:homoaconitase [Caldithrix abyssi]
MAQNLIEKIAQKYCLDLREGEEVHSGDFVTIRPAHVMTHDNTAAVMPKFFNIGLKKVADPRQIVFTLDHNVQDTGEKNLAKYKKIETFAAEQGIDFYPAGRGIGHQIMCEEGYAWPGTFVVASDSHSNMYGGLGCLGTPIVRSDAAAVWATGKTWWQVPQVAKVELSGTLAEGVTGKDVIITLAGFFNKDEVLNHALEFSGDGVAALSLDQRLTIANMSTEWGALAALFPIDDVTLDWLQKRLDLLNREGNRHPRINRERLEDLKNNPPQADDNAYYKKTIRLELGSVTPHISGPNSVKVMHSARELKEKHIKIHKAYLVSCVNSRVEDLAQAARIVKGKKVAEGVEFYVSAASSEVQKESMANGDWQALVEAGARTLPPGCGPCIGLGEGLLQDNEVGISATNRNFKGRMGSPNAEAYLASPAVVAASALSGYITPPADFDDRPLKTEVRENPASNAPGRVTVLAGFPGSFKGRALLCPANNINTDGIYPGKYTYREDLTPEMMAAVVMENYDPNFTKIARKGDILLAGFNFGTGSSREQAATALKYFGIQMVIAGSFSETYKRNAINNGFTLLECPALIGEMMSAAGTELTQVADGELEVSMTEGLIRFGDKEYGFNAPGPVAQELIIHDGLENWVKKQLT